MPKYKINHGSFKLDALICTRSATMFIDSMRGHSAEAMGDIEKNSVVILDKMVAAIYYCHKAYCEDEDIPVQVKRSEIFEKISFNANVEQSNIEKFMQEFAKSMEDVTEKMTSNASKKKKVKPTIR